MLFVIFFWWWWRGWGDHRLSHILHKRDLALFGGGVYLGKIDILCKISVEQLMHIWSAKIYAIFEPLIKHNFSGYDKGSTSFLSYAFLQISSEIIIIGLN